jgi:hypothetical protein
VSPAFTGRGNCGTANLPHGIDIPYYLVSSIPLYNDCGRCELVLEIQPEESLTIHQRVHLLALVGSLAVFLSI